MPGTGEVRYLVLADRAVPYLLARVRWPDIAQAISAAGPDWLHDPGLFDLPYDPAAVTVSFSQAASVAASWGRQLHPGAAEGGPSYIRRMPANWSDLSPSERRAWGIEFVGTRRGPARRVRRPRRSEAKIAVSSAAAQANGHLGALAGAEDGPGPDGAAANGHRQMPEVTRDPARVATERRRHPRVRVDGLVHIRSGPTTISAGLVDLSEAGVRCVLPEAAVITTRICLDTAARISWHRGVGASTHFGVAFGELADGETEGVKRLLAAARSRGGHR
jgi:hypothetical protein